MIKNEKNLNSKTLRKLLKSGVGVSFTMMMGLSVLGATAGHASAQDLRMRSDIVPANVNTDIGTSSNGSTVVNIANPNQGISFNQYDRFNIGTKENVVLNNSKTTGESVIGGTIQANDKLTDSAKVIVNEVTGSASKLAGNLEIFGKRADLVIANENGITVDGAKFINASNLTLTNGKILNHGKSIGISTKDNGSSVVIGSNGLNTDSEYLNLIGSKVEVNGSINDAKHTSTNINIIAGESSLEYDGKDLVMANHESTSKNTKALSASAAGSMYGNNVFILSTNKDAQDDLEGTVKATGNLSVTSSGTLTSKDLQGKNVALTAAKEIVNTGKVKADADLDLNAPKVINKSTVSGDVTTDVTNKITEYNTRVRGTWVYNDFVIKETSHVDFTNNLKVEKATMEAGSNINVNRNVENGSFVNEGGNVAAGKDFNVKGDFNTSTPVKALKVVKALEQIKTDRHWERRSLVDGRWFGNGEQIQHENMLASLVRIANIRDNYTAKGYYEALKLVKDPALTDLLNGLLGGDWRTRTTIKPIAEWNMDATVNFGTGSAASIKAGDTLKINGSNVVLGSGSTKAVATKNTVEKDSFDSIVADVERDAANSVVSAKNIVIKADNLKDSNTDLVADNYLIIKSDKGIEAKGGAFKADKAIVSTKGNLDMSSKIGFDENGQEVVTGASGIQTTVGAQVNAKDITLYGADLTATEGGLKVNADNITANNINTLKSFYNYDRKDQKGLGFGDYTNRKELRAEISPVISKLQAKTVDIDASHNVQVRGSLVSGVDQESLVNIKAGGRVNITNADTIAYDKYYNDSRGRGNDGDYHFLALNDNLHRNVAVLPSTLRSGGNITISSSNMHVQGSKVVAGKALSIKVKQNLDLLSALSKEQDNMYNLNWGNGALHASTDNTTKDVVNGTTIQAGEGLLLEADADINTESAHIKGSTVDIVAQGNVNNTAKQNITNSYTSKVDAGFNASGKVSLGGMGVAGSINTVTGAKETVVSGPKGILETSNDFKKAELTGTVGAELHFSDTTKDVKETANNTIVSTAGNVNITAGGTAEIGNTDLNSTNNVTVDANRVTTNNLTNSSKTSTNSLDLSASVTATATNPTVNKVNDVLNKVSDVKTKFDAEDYKGSFDKVKEIKDDAVNIAKGLPTALKEDVTTIHAEENVGLDYKHTSDKTNATNANNIEAAGNVNIVAHNGDVSLNGSNVKADTVKLTSEKGNVTIGSGITTTVHTEDSINAGLKAHEEVGLSIKDGAKATIGLTPTAKYEGSADVKRVSTPSNIETNKLETNAEKVETATKNTTYFHDNRHVGGSGDLTVGVSSNHAAVVSGNFSGDAGYHVEAGHVFVNPANGKEVDLGVHAGVNVAAGINSDGTNGKVSVNTEEAAVTINKENIVAAAPKEDITKGVTKDNLKEKIQDYFKQSLMNTLKGSLY